MIFELFLLPLVDKQVLLGIVRAGQLWEINGIGRWSTERCRTEARGTARCAGMQHAEKAHRHLLMKKIHTEKNILVVCTKTTSFLRPTSNSKQKLAALLNQQSTICSGCREIKCNQRCNLKNASQRHAHTRVVYK